MNDFERSMELERAFTNVSRVVCELKPYDWYENNKAKKDGKEPNPILKSWIEALESAKKTIRKESDNAYLKYAESHPMNNDNGFAALAVAVLSQAARDYERALCSDGEDAENMIREVEEFAKTDACIYTTLDFSEILKSIKYRHKKFVKKSHKDIESIIFNTKKLKKHGFGDKYNPNRCPLCGGGMYIRGKISGKTATVGCTNCELVEVVELGA